MDNKDEPSTAAHSTQAQSAQAQSTAPQTTAARPHHARSPRRSDGDHQPVFPEQRLRVRAWPDPVLDNLGHDPRSAYVEQYWLSILGPSATLLLRRLGGALEAKPDGFELDPGQWALELGLGARGGKHGPFWRSIDRACRFGTAQRNGELLAVRRRLPPLTARQVDRLPDHLKRAHQIWTARQLERPRRKTISQWSAARGEGPGQAPEAVS